MMYYNSDLKERYFKEKSRNVNVERFFKVVAKYEQDLDKDCYDFTVKEILDMYKSIATKSWEYLLNLNSQLKLYTTWCQRQNLIKDNQNHYYELDKSDIYVCLNHGLKEALIITRKELLKNIRKFDNPSDQFLVLAIFEGISGYKYLDFYDLNMSAIKGNIITLSDNRKLEISNELIKIAEESVNEYRKFNNGEECQIGYKKDDPSIIKESANSRGDLTSHNNYKRIYNRLVRLQNIYGNIYNYGSLRNSGRINMITELMIKQKNDNPYEIYEKNRNDIEYRYGQLEFRTNRWIEEYEQFFGRK